MRGFLRGIVNQIIAHAIRVGSSRSRSRLVHMSPRLTAARSHLKTAMNNCPRLGHITRKGWETIFVVEATQITALLKLVNSGLLAVSMHRGDHLERPLNRTTWVRLCLGSNIRTPATIMLGKIR